MLSPECTDLDLAECYEACWSKYLSYNHPWEQAAEIHRRPVNRGECGMCKHRNGVEKSSLSLGQQYDRSRAERRLYFVNKRIKEAEAKMKETAAQRAEDERRHAERMRDLEYQKARDRR